VKHLKPHIDRIVAAAASLTGTRFNLLVSSSLVATAAILASALGGGSSGGALAALLGPAPSSQAPAPSSAASEELPSGGSSPTPSTGTAGTPASPPAGIPSSPPPTSEAASEPSSPPSQTPPPAPTGPVGPIKHVFVISLASPGYEESFGSSSQMPYLSTTLRPQGQLVPGYSLLSEAALPNGIAMISGQPPNPATEGNCAAYEEFPSGTKGDGKGRVSGAGCVYPVETLTLADQLGSARMTWRGYVDEMADDSGPHNCVRPAPGAAAAPSPGAYAAWQNPFIYFHSLLDLGDCASNDVPLDQLSKDLNKEETAPDFALVAPTPCNAGFVGQCPEGTPDGAAAADAFLAKWAPKIIASPAFKEGGLMIVAFNGLGSASQTTSTGAAPSVGTAPSGSDSQGSNPLRVGALLVSHYVSRGGTREGEFNPYSLLRSSEEIFGLSPLAEAGTATAKSLGSDLLGPQF
jgi:hypothetical protein